VPDLVLPTSGLPVVAGGDGTGRKQRQGEGQSGEAETFHRESEGAAITGQESIRQQILHFVSGIRIVEP
jgi:hypothetical protein